MEDQSGKNKVTGFEVAFINLSKRLILIVAGSGLLTNALYLYGLSYYEEYIVRLGFDYHLFSIKWDDALYWAYLGSREIGVSTLNVWVTISQPMLWMFFLVMYFLIRIWVAIANIDNSNAREERQEKAQRRADKIKILMNKFIPKKYKLS